jgi:dethiobiotin synthetase
MSQGFFVTGTDTGVGKTTVACALVRALAGLDLRVAAMKPVASGCRAGPDGMRCDDVLALEAAANVRAARALVNPYAFAPGIAPHLAAQSAGVAIAIERIVAAYAALARQADAVVVEGVGGFRVPLGQGVDTADLAAALGLPIVLVVGLRLGCINHALLTAEAIAHRGLVFAGWIGNVLDPALPALDGNIAALTERLPAPCLGIHPHAGREPAVGCGAMAAAAARLWLHQNTVINKSTG